MMKHRLVNFGKRALQTSALLACPLGAGIAAAQNTAIQPDGLDYSYAELRFIDVDAAGGDGFRLNGSLELQNNWLLVGGLTAIDFNNNVDSTQIEIGGGYVWQYSQDFDLIGTIRVVHTSIDAGLNDTDDTGLALSGGVRGLLTPRFEVRGSVNHIHLDNSDTYLEVAGDYYFSQRLSAGISLEFAGDRDNLTIGARWFFD